MEKINGDGEVLFCELNEVGREGIFGSLTYSLCGNLICGGFLALRLVLLLWMIWDFRPSPLHMEARLWNISLADFPSSTPWFVMKPRANPSHLNLVTCKKTGRQNCQNDYKDTKLFSLT